MKKNSSLKTAKRLFSQLKDQKARLIIVALSIVCYTVLNVVTPFYSAILLNELTERVGNGTFSLAWDALGKELTIMSVMYILLGLFYILQSFLMASVAESLVFRLRKQIAAKFNRLPLKFFDRNQPGEILSRVTGDLDRVSETLQTGLLRFLISVGTIIGSLAFMFYYSWMLTLIFLGFMAVSAILTKVVSGKTLANAAKRQEEVANLTSLTEEYYTGRNIIKAYNNEENSVKKMNAEIDNVCDISQKVDFLTNCLNPVVRGLTKIAQAIILLICCKQMLGNAMTFGVAQAYFQYIALCGDPMTEASFMLNSMQSALASAERTFEFLDGEEEEPDTATPKTINHASGEVEFRNVAFGYGEKLLMKDISFSAKTGQKIAIVGETGAGKTTLVNLLMRFYEVKGGAITLDGVSTRDLTRKNLRENFGMVLQDTWLFAGTIAQNIAYGRPDATREEIVQAAKMARADFFIRTMPQGYDTEISNEADSLSVGQRQLLTIARVFLCNPPLLILDEATSSVDTRTESQIVEAMNLLMANRTSFVIAHRLSTIVDADLILFMQNGDIIEQGTHEQLLAKNGAYASLYNSQFA